jgi:EAL and modified HD-GYP domain-containing signal transduction protein
MVFLGRQPIFDRRLKVHGYELLFRSAGDSQSADVADGDLSTARVLFNTFVEIGLENVVGGGRAYVNVTRGFLIEKYAFQLPRERVVLELLEDIVVDQPLIDAVRELSDAGYTLALDDFTLRDELVPLLEFASIVKVDLRALDSAALDAHLAELRSRSLVVLAEKVETQEEFERVVTLGFDLFQGYFFERPSIVHGRRQPTNRLAALELLAELQGPDADIQKVEALVMRDATVSFQVLRLINSAFYALPRRVDSIREAVIMLGMERIRTWAAILVLARVSDKPHELLVTALVRARMAALIADAQGLDADQAFTVGLFSALDAILDMPMEDVLGSLPLAPAIANAVLRNEGPLGRNLAYILASERGDWVGAAGDMEVEADTLGKLHLEAVVWADRASRAIAA